MKKILVFSLIMFAAISLSAQITGKYAAAQFASSDSGITLSKYIPLEIGGDNYAWNIAATWADSSVVTTSTICLQVSPDASLWMDRTCDSIDNVTHYNYAATDALHRYIRLKLAVTSGDTIYGLKAWYEFKRK